MLVANDILGNVDLQQDQSERREAKEWLKDFLADGPVAARKIQGEAKAAGLSWMTVRRAKDSLGVVASKSNFHGGWEWHLEDAQREDAHPIHRQASTFEQAIENTKLKGKRANEGAHRSEVSTFDAFEENSEVRV